MWPDKIEGNTWNPTWSPRSRASVFAFCAITACLAVGTFLDSLALATWEKYMAELYLLAAAGFVYTNYVTTFRSRYLTGKHGDRRDIVTVFALLPVAAYLGLGLTRFGWRSPDLTFGGSDKAVKYSASAASVDWSLATSGPVAQYLLSQPWVRDRLATAAAWPMWPSKHAVYRSVFVLSYWLGLHAPYITRPGMLLSRSMSQKDMATAGWRGFVGFGVKIGFVLYCFLDHGRWAWDNGVLLPRLLAYALIVAAIAGISYCVRDQYYWHLHHWFVGLLLAPVAHGTSPGWSLALMGLSLSQFIEGAARWSCAPLWHKLQD